MKCSEDEAKEVLAYDLTLTDKNEGKCEFDLPPDKRKDAKKFSHTGTRKAPVAFKFAKKERKPNATKGGLIEELATLLQESSGFAIENFQIPNKEGKVSFQIGDKWYSFTLTAHRTKPEWCK